MTGRPALEVADIFRQHGPAWRDAQRGHLSLAQLKVMSAIEQCRSAALGGHVLRCEGCGTDQLAYNSCRNRHCPKCQSAAARRWLDARQADLLPVEYYHVVFTLPAPIVMGSLLQRSSSWSVLPRTERVCRTGRLTTLRRLPQRSRRAAGTVRPALDRWTRRTTGWPSRG